MCHDLISQPTLVMEAETNFKQIHGDKHSKKLRKSRATSSRGSNSLKLSLDSNRWNHEITDLFLYARFFNKMKHSYSRYMKLKKNLLKINDNRHLYNMDRRSVWVFKTASWTNSSNLVQIGWKHARNCIFDLYYFIVIDQNVDTPL